MFSRNRVALSFALCTLVAACVFAQPDEEKVYTLTKSARTLEQIEKIYAGMPPVKYTPPKERFDRLPRTMGLLQRGREVRLLMLGDSIVNDTSRSSFEHLIAKDYPEATLVKITVVRGSTGCWWYKEEGRVEKYVLRHKPDLILIGGISQREDVESIKSVIAQVRTAESKAEFLLLTPVFGRVDPCDDKQWSAKINMQGKDYRAKLAALAKEQECAFLDMTAAWGQYVRDSGKEIDWFKRDEVHANEHGEQILGRILASYFKP